MRRDLVPSIVAVVLFTVVLGLGYPLVVTVISQIAFPGKADGSRIARDGETVGSELIAQDFERDPRYFQPRPSQTGYSGDVTYFNNLGPNSRDLKNFFVKQANRYVALEGDHVPGGLELADVPVDAVTTSGSGVDPHISEANAGLQAHRVAEERGIELGRLQELIEENTDGRALGFLGEPGVNVLTLNLEVDEEAAR